MFKTIISTSELEARLGDPTWVVVDTRSKQSAEHHGETAYTRSHIPGAVYANLDRDLAAPHVPGFTGRHPLPTVEDFSQTLSRLGVDSSKQVVVYDDMGGAYAARMWWMLRWLGHKAVAVLDGGWDKWVSGGLATDSTIPDPEPKVFVARANPKMIADEGDVERARHDQSVTLLDARSADRYRGENETLDPVAGHIPTAVSLPYSENLNADGTFKPVDVLKRRFEATLSNDSICYCGSGVTAAHNILAMVLVGLPEPAMYVGSWSHWITDRSRPTE